MIEEASFGLSVRVLTTTHPREWRRGTLNMANGTVLIGAELVQRQQVLAIAHLPQCRRDVPPPSNPSDPTVPIG